MQTQITYLDNSGFAVKTKRHFLIFDCWAKHPANGKQGLAGGIIVPEELTGKYVTVFVSHAHGDHFNPMIFEDGRIKSRIFVTYFLTTSLRVRAR